MKFFRASLFVLGILFLYGSCKKSEKIPQSGNQGREDSKVTSMTQFTPASQQRVITTVPNGFPNPGALVNTYKGNTRTYDCGTNSWTYTFTWEAFGTASSVTPGTGSFTLGSFTQTAPAQITSIYNRYSGSLLLGTVWVMGFTISGVPDDNNFCVTDAMQNSITYSGRAPGPLGPITFNGSANTSESVSPNTYFIAQFITPSYSALGNNSFSIHVMPAILACGPCHGPALGFSPTVYFYYHLVGSSDPWLSVSRAGSDQTLFSVTVAQAGTYEYYTQGVIDQSGNLSPQLYPGTITVQ